MQYLRELKWVAVRIILVFVIVFSVIWNYSNLIMEQILKLSDLKIITVSPIETIKTECMISLVLTVFVMLPYIVIELYRFVYPALTQKERKFIKIGVSSLYGSFLIGVSAFGYCFLKCAFFIIDRYQITGIQQTSSEYEYVSFIVSSLVICGLLACIPCVITALTYFNLIKIEWLTKYWKQFVISSMVLSAIVAPGADILSMLLLEIPILVLYFVSIILSKLIENIKNIKGDIKCSEQQILY